MLPPPTERSATATPTAVVTSPRVIVLESADPAVTGTVALTAPGNGLPTEATTVGATRLTSYVFTSLTTRADSFTPATVSWSSTMSPRNQSRPGWNEPNW